MLRVLHLDTGEEMRGGQRQLLMLATALRRDGHDQLVACPEGSALAAEAAKGGLECWTAPLRRRASLAAMGRLRRVIVRGGYEIVHAHDGRGQTLSWLASCRLPVCRVASRRVTFLPRSHTLHRFKYTYTCNGVIAVSCFIRGLLVDSGVPPRLIEVIPDGVVIPALLPSPEQRAELRRKWQFEPNHFVIGHVGAFTAEKGQSILLEAFDLVAKVLPQARLLLAGDGPLRERLEVQWRSHTAGHRVRFLGYMEDLTSVMDSLDLFVMPSLKEGLGSAAIVAMAHGVPVVAACAGGLPEVVEHQKTGWLVPPANAPALASAVEVAESNRERTLQFGKNARERAALFSDDIMAKRTIDFYMRLLARPEGDPRCDCEL